MMQSDGDSQSRIFRRTRLGILISLCDLTIVAKGGDSHPSAVLHTKLIQFAGLLIHQKLDKCSFAFKATISSQMAMKQRE
jgi:hypothetical protein